VDYIALGHLHTKYQKENRVYAGATFPNNSGELETLKCGSFYIVDTSGKIERHEIKLKEVLVLDLEINDSIVGADKIIEELKNHELKDKIFILKLKGILERGRISDIDFNKIELFAEEQGVYVFLKNTTKLQSLVQEVEIELKSANAEEEIISKFKEKNNHKFNELVSPLILSLQIEKKEDESARVFDDRLFSEVKKIISYEA